MDDNVKAWRDSWEPGAERNEEKNYVCVNELKLKVGNWGWCAYAWACGNGIFALRHRPTAT